MKYNININQKVLSKTKLDLIDCAILDYLIFICSSRNKRIEKERWNGKTWIDLNHLIEDMPLIGIKTKGALSLRINRIKGEGFVETEMRKSHNRLYVDLTEKVDGVFLEKNGGVFVEKRGCFCRKTNNNTNNNNDDNRFKKIKQTAILVKGVSTADKLLADPDCIREKKAERQRIVAESRKTRRPATWVYDLLSRMKKELGIKSLSMRGDASGKALKELKADIEEQEGKQDVEKLKERIWKAYLKLKKGWKEEKYGQCTFVKLRKYWGENDPDNGESKKDLSWML